MIFDIHSNSNRQNIVIQGNIEYKDSYESKILPFLLSRVSPLFSFENFGSNK